MSDELRAWLEEQRFIAESSSEPEREIMLALIAKVEELAEALDHAGEWIAAVEVAKMPGVGDTQSEVLDEIESALREPGEGHAISPQEARERAEYEAWQEIHSDEIRRTYE